MLLGRFIKRLMWVVICESCKLRMLLGLTIKYKVSGVRFQGTEVK